MIAHSSATVLLLLPILAWSSGSLDQSSLVQVAPAGGHKHRINKMLDEIWKQEGADNMGDFPVVLKPKEDQYWKTCSKVSLGNYDVSNMKATVRNFMKDSKMTEYKYCGDPDKKKDYKSVTCGAIRAAIRATYKFQGLFPNGPAFKNYYLNDWNGTSWHPAHAANVDKSQTPPRATWKLPNAANGFGLCEMFRTILHVSPNQGNTGTCGFTAVLASIMLSNPSKALKMSMRLAWAGYLTEHLPKPCPAVYDMQPGLVPWDNATMPCNFEPYYEECEKEVNLSYTDPKYDHLVAKCTKKKCTEKPVPKHMSQPFQDDGIQFMWYQALASSVKKQASAHLSCQDDKMKPEVGYAKMPFEVWKHEYDRQGLFTKEGLLICQNVIDPRKCSCHISYNKELCKVLKDSKGCGKKHFCPEAEAPSFSEKNLKEACKIANGKGAAMLSVNADALQKDNLNATYYPIGNKKYAETADHVVVLAACDEKNDNYTIWTWSDYYYFNKRYILGDVLSAEDSPIKKKGPYTTGWVFLATLANEVTFVPGSDEPKPKCADM